jgi:hypothetical protein
MIDRRSQAMAAGSSIMKPATARPIHRMAKKSIISCTHSHPRTSMLGVEKAILLQHQVLRKLQGPRRSKKVDSILDSHADDSLILACFVGLALFDLPTFQAEFLECHSNRINRFLDNKDFFAHLV